MTKFQLFFLQIFMALLVAIFAVNTYSTLSFEDNFLSGYIGGAVGLFLKGLWDGTIYEKY